MIHSANFDSLESSYADDGFFLSQSLFTSEELAGIGKELEGAGSFRPAITVNEDNSTVVRSVYGGHESSPIFRRLIADARLVLPVMHLLKAEVYLYQFKVNMKGAFCGDVWPWHQDFAFWRHLDGMLRPDAVTVTLFLDDVTEFNAPLFCVPGSHKAGLHQFDETIYPTTADDLLKQELDVSSKLRFTLTQEKVGSLVRAFGLHSARAPRGSVFFFHPNLVHASGVNMSPFNRRQVLITYNSVANALVRKSQRSKHLSGAFENAITPLSGPWSEASLSA